MSWSKGFFVFTFFLLSGRFLLAQPAESELRASIAHAKDTSLVNAYLALGKHYYRTTGTGDSLLKYAHLALAESNRLGSRKKELESLISVATGYLVLGADSIAEMHYFESLKRAAALRDLKSLADIHNKLGVLYYNSERPEKAIEQMIQSARYSEAIGDYDKLCYAYYGISSVYVYLDQNEKRLSYIFKALTLIREHPEIPPGTQEIIFSSAAQHYLEVADSGAAYIDSAYYFAQTGLAIAKANDFNGRKPTYFNIISDYYYRKGDLDRSMNYIDTALHFNGYLRSDTRFILYLRLASIYSSKQQKQSAYNYLDSISTMPLLSEHYFAMKYASVAYGIYKKFGDTKRALELLESKIDHESLLKDLQREELINELDKKYQTERKDHEILKLSQQQQIDALKIENNESRIRWLAGLVIISILIIAIVLIVFRQARINNKIRMMETEQRLNRARINPHFFFNAMASLQNLAMQEKSTQTSQFLSRFARIMRLSLESTYQELITLEQEIDFLTQYLELQKLRFPEKFDYQFELDPQLELNELKLPGMILQPFAENAIEHGFSNLSYRGKLTISIQGKSDQLEIRVRDNGRGLQKDEKKSAYPSRAIQITRERIAFFGGQFTKGARVEQGQSLENAGFEIVIHLPKVYTPNESTHH